MVTLPENIYLTSIAENWKIDYLFSPVKTRLIVCPQKSLTIIGNHHHFSECQKILRTWLMQKAEEILSNYLHSLSQQLALPFTGLSIRDQKTRWGSCSSKKMINLNFRLILLPENVMRHILVHELCHTVYLNHSNKFWRLVAKYDPEWRAHHQISKRGAEKYLPNWINIVN